MVIDTSAIIAVLLNEANAPRITQAIERASLRLLSAANLLEASIVIDSRKGEAGGREIDLLIYRANIEIVAVDQDQAEIARIAWRRFGKGRHPAALNYGTVLPTPLPSRSACRCFTWATISRKPISKACSKPATQKCEKSLSFVIPGCTHSSAAQIQEHRSRSPRSRACSSVKYNVRLVFRSDNLTAFSMASRPCRSASSLPLVRGGV